MAGIQQEAVKRFSGQQWLSGPRVNSPWMTVFVVDEPEMTYHIFISR